DAIEFDWVVGPVSVKDGVPKEVFVRYRTDLANNQTFYTDANGRQMMRRVVNQRPTWKWNAEEPISGNYYPVVSRIAIQDQKRDLQVTVLTDRAQGGTSLRDGELELMLNRRLPNDRDMLA